MSHNTKKCNDLIINLQWFAGKVELVSLPILCTFIKSTFLHSATVMKSD